MASYNPGTYEGTGRGYGGKLIVSVTVSENRIESVKVTQHKEYRGIAWGLNTTPIERYPKLIVEYQTLNIPTVDGADLTCAAILDATAAALKAAGASKENIAALKAAPAPKAPEYQDEVRTVDVVVCGAGAGGLAAAIEAKLAGAEVVIVEKQGITGGATARSGGKLLGAGTKWQKKQGLYDNTVIIFASDHGSHFKTRNRDAHLNGYDDYKRSCHDGCLHVPLVICGGPFKGGREVTELVSTESIPKTLLALAGVDVGDKMIGENLLDVVEKKNDNRANEVFAQISESRCGRCIRTADYMYSVYAPGVNGGEAAASDVYADDFLYDMKKDPWQLNNVVADPAYAVVKAELRERLLNWIERAEGARPTITD